jgi:hypothetical protein
MTRSRRVTPYTMGEQGRMLRPLARLVGRRHRSAAPCQSVRPAARARPPQPGSRAGECGMTAGHHLRPGGASTPAGGRMSRIRLRTTRAGRTVTLR